MISAIFITGPSGCGKSTVASAVSKSLQERGTILVRLFHQDDYFTMPFIPYSDRHDTSYESDSGIDFSKLKADMENYAKEIERELREVHAGNVDEDEDLLRNYDEAVIIVEGHIIGAAAESLCHSISYFDGDMHLSNTISILIDCSRDICKQRRLNRRKRSKEEWEQLSSYFDRAVWKGFQEYGIAAMQLLREKTKTESERTIHNGDDECSCPQNGFVLDICTEQEESLSDNVLSILAAFDQSKKNS